MKQLRWIIFICILLSAILPIGCAQEQEVEVQAVALDNNGKAWVGTANGLFVQGDDGVLHYMPLPSLTHHAYASIYAITNDSVRNLMWIGAWNHLYCYDIQRDRFITIADSTIYRVVSLSTDSVGRVLAKTERGLFRLTQKDSLNEEKTEQIDNNYYAKPDITKINTDGLKFDSSKSNRYAGYVIAIMIALALVMAIVIYVMRRKRNQNETTVAENVDNVEDMPARPSFIEQATRVVNAHLNDEDFTPEQFASEMAVSRAQLFRKLKSANGQTVMEFINEQRLTHAIKLLKTTDRTIADIATACGYADVSSFRRLFIKRFGVTPSQYRQENIR